MTSSTALCMLYYLTQASTGPILEQGAFVGLSATAIALSLRDSGSERMFFSNDLFPAAFKDVDARQEPAVSVPYKWRTNPKDKSQVDEFIRDYKELTIPKHAYAAFFKDKLDRPGGQLHDLFANLHLNRLNEYVIIIAGEAVPKLNFGFVWSDAAHTPEEIAKNREGWLDVCRRQPGKIVVWAFHDRVSQAHFDGIDTLFTDKGHTVNDRFDSPGAAIYAVEVK